MKLIIALAVILSCSLVHVYSQDFCSDAQVATVQQQWADTFSTDELYSVFGHDYMERSVLLQKYIVSILGLMQTRIRSSLCQFITPTNSASIPLGTIWDMCSRLILLPLPTKLWRYWRIVIPGVCLSVCLSVRLTAVCLSHLCLLAGYLKL